MTLEEIRAMAACNPPYFDHCHSCMLNTGEGSGRGKCSAEDDRGPLGQPALAALLVRAVEALKDQILHCEGCGGGGWYYESGEIGIRVSCPVCTSARSLLRELEVEA